MVQQSDRIDFTKRKFHPLSVEFITHLVKPVFRISILLLFYSCFCHGMALHATSFFRRMGPCTLRG